MKEEEASHSCKVLQVTQKENGWTFWKAFGRLKREMLEEQRLWTGRSATHRETVHHPNSQKKDLS